LKRALVWLAVVACYDPVQEDAEVNLGIEDPFVPKGPLHRPGQPCTTCHSEGGWASSSPFSVAGTLYQVRGGTAPLVSGRVEIVDAEGRKIEAVSNEAGNFFLRASDVVPTFPLRVAIEAQGVRREMTTRIGRSGSCAACHRATGDASYMPAVFLKDAP